MTASSRVNEAKSYGRGYHRSIEVYIPVRGFDKERFNRIVADFRKKIKMEFCGEARCYVVT